MIRKLKWGVEIHVEGTDEDVEELKSLMGVGFTKFVELTKAITDKWEENQSSDTSARDESE